MRSLAIRGELAIPPMLLRLPDNAFKSLLHKNAEHPKFRRIRRGENEYFAVPQHIRMGKGSARLIKFPKGVRFKGSEERPAEIGEARQLVVTNVAG